MAEVRKPEDLKAAMIAAIMNAGGDIEVTFEQLGEASLTEKEGMVSVAVERTAAGVRYFLTEDSEMKLIKEVEKVVRRGEEGDQRR